MKKRSLLTLLAVPATAAVLMLTGGVADAGTTSQCHLIFPGGYWVCTSTTYTGTAPPGCRVGSPC